MKTTAEQTHTFLYDGWNLIREDLGAATPSSRFYVWGLDLSGSLQGAGGVGGLLAVATTANDMSAIALATADANGNITEYVDGGGSIVARYEYDAFGNTIAQSGDSADINPFRFTTKYTDDESGLVYYGYRFYHPELGRWVNRDPIGEEGGINLYTALFNNGMHYYDALGQYPIECCGDISACTWTGSISGSYYGAIIGVQANMTMSALGTNGKCNWAVSGAGSDWLGGAGLFLGWLTANVDFEVEAPCQWPIGTTSYATLTFIGMGGSVGVPISLVHVWGQASSFEGSTFMGVGGFGVFVGGGAMGAHINVSRVGPSPVGQ